MRLAVLKERRAFETRVAATPETVKKLTALGLAIAIETGAGLRPAFPDNLPRIRIENRVIYVNGLYRHGFLLAPALARRVAAVALHGASVAEAMDANPGQRQDA